MAYKDKDIEDLMTSYAAYLRRLDGETLAELNESNPQNFQAGSVVKEDFDKVYSAADKLLSDINKIDVELLSDPAADIIKRAAALLEDIIVL